MLEGFSTSVTLRAHLTHKRTGKPLLFSAVVEHDPDGTFSIRYSHTGTGIAGGKPWFSDSLSHAYSSEDAEACVAAMADLVEDSQEIVVWDENLVGK